MAWTTPGTATAGDVLTAAFWNTQVRDNMVELAPMFSAWTASSPTISQGVTTNIATTSKTIRYVQIGKLVFGSFTIVMNGNGTAGSIVTVSLPVAAGAVGVVIGSGWIFDNSTSTRYQASVSSETSTTMSFQGDWSANSSWGVTPNLALAASDQLRGFLMYETT